MPNFTAKDVNALRQRTSMGMMECKKALTDADGDVDEAIRLLRERAGGKMADRGDREAAEGAVGVAVGDGAAAIVVVTAETDFAARNEDFTKTVDTIAQQALTLSGTGDITGSATDDMSGKVEDLRLTIKENINLKLIYRLEAPKLGSYLHTDRKSGAIVAGEGELGDDLLKGLAMHVTANQPEAKAVDADSLPVEDVDAARKQFTDEAAATGKPQNIAEKIAEGKMKKWSDEITLTGQVYIRELDAKKAIREYLPGDAKITGFVRAAVG